MCKFFHYNMAGQNMSAHKILRHTFFKWKFDDLPRLHSKPKTLPTEEGIFYLVILYLVESQQIPIHDRAGHLLSILQ